MRPPLLALLLTAPAAAAANRANPVTLPAGDAATIMDDARTNRAASHRPTELFQVMAIVLFVWAGIALYLFILDRKVAKLERDVRALHDNSR